MSKKSINLALIICSLLLSGCMSFQPKSDPSRFYILNSKESPEEWKIDTGRTLGIGRVLIPDYLDRPNITIEQQAGEMQFDEFNRWAQPLGEDITRVLFQNLSFMLNHYNVVRLPFPQKIDRDYDLYVSILDFKPQCHKNHIYFQAQFSIFDSKASTQIHTGVVTLLEPINLYCSTYLEISQAMSSILERFSKQIADGFNEIGRNPEPINQSKEFH